MLISHNAALFEKTTEDLTAYQMAYLEAMNDGVSSGFTKSEILKKYSLGTSANIKVIQKALVEKKLSRLHAIAPLSLIPCSPFGSKTNPQTSNMIIDGSRIFIEYYLSLLRLVILSKITNGIDRIDNS